jgi:hypothetical protein
MTEGHRADTGIKIGSDVKMEKAMEGIDYSAIENDSRHASAEYTPEGIRTARERYREQ